MTANADGVFQDNYYTDNQKAISWKKVGIDGSDWFKLQQIDSGKWLDAGSKLPFINEVTGDRNPYQQWQFTDVPFNVNVSLVSIKYDTPEEHDDSYPLSLMSENVIENQTNATIIKTISSSREQENTFEFGFSETLAVGLEVEFSAGIPGFAGGKTTGSINLSVEANQTKTVTTTQDYSVSTEISVPANEKISVGAFVYWNNNISAKFVSKYRVSGTWLTDQSPMTVPNDKLKEYLYSKGCTGTIDEILPGSVTVTVNGVFNGAYGLDEHVSVKPYTPIPDKTKTLI